MRDGSQDAPESAQIYVECEDHEAPSQDGTPQLSAPAAATAVALGLATAACGGGSSSSGGGATGGAPTGGGGTPPPVILKPETDAQAARFILRAAIAASPGAISQIKADGYEPWLDSQMALGNDQTAAQFFSSRGYDRIDGNRHFDRSGPADNMIWSQLMRGNSSVRKRAALALSEFFVVSLNSVNITWRSPAMGAYWDILNQHAFGNFRDLIEDITLNPAMGVFLNTRGNRKADARSGRVPDENFGREVMQLFSIGLYELNADGTLRAGPNGDPIETYDNDDVTGIAKAFTGYDYDYTGISSTPDPNNGNRQIPDPDYARQAMTADPSKWRRPRSESYHSDEEKTFLGVTIPASTGAAETLRITLDTLFNHPNVGPFFGKQMIQRLVTSNPSPAYVQRVASVFDNNGSGTRGDLRAVFKAILLDDEALAESGLTDQRFGKLREPMIRFAQWGRTFGANSASADWTVGNLSDSSNRLGQAPLRSPSVFNFFRPGYVPLNSQAAANDLIAPEFQIVNESTVATYVNFMERSVDNRGYWVRDVKAPYTEELKIAHDAPALLDRLDLLLTGQQLNSNTRDTILAALNDQAVAETDDDETKLRRIHIAVLLVMVSNDYLVQK
ncbi:DUF1800 domain-containing protein [Parerythrobacter jejuensis]|uniref:DUF1800 family protein n=1 Tax=Parerythrobacter jejuensis TaxID=795812 RepID=A0A845ARX9_9SPHN|nr:DUF1800 family protein [Parerythrobacter jejuensis]MXP31685.1 DUF1800 family protein [Parerythrobacter jejuensis]